MSYRNRKGRLVILALVLGLSSLLIPIIKNLTVRADDLGADIHFSTANSMDLYMYVKAGEKVKASFTRKAFINNTGNTYPESAGTSTIVLKSPSGWSSTPVVINLGGNNGDIITIPNIPVATTDGVWHLNIKDFTVSLPPYTSLTRLYNWNVGVYNSQDVVIPGRVWTDTLRIVQDSAQNENINLFFLDDVGMLYQMSLGGGYNGINSTFRASKHGHVYTNTCNSVYGSYDSRVNQSTNRFVDNNGTCGRLFKIFFANPLNAGMPEIVDMPDGSLTSLSVEPKPTIITSLNFTRGNDANVLSGKITADVKNYYGNATLLIDTNGDDDFNDPVDIKTTVNVTGDIARDAVGNGSTMASGNVNYAFNGKDATDRNIPIDTKLNFQLVADRKGEIHFSRGDAETAGSIKMSRLTGSSNNKNHLFWNDSQLTSYLYCGNTTMSATNPANPINASGGVNSSAGVHGWDSVGCVASVTSEDGSSADRLASWSWGNNRFIEDWTYDMGASVNSNIHTYINTPPVITTQDITIFVGDTVNLLNDLVTSSTDKEDGNVIDKVTVLNDGGFDNNKTGVYTVTYTVTDSGGLTATNTAKITVIAPAPPKAGHGSSSAIIMIAASLMLFVVGGIAFKKNLKIKNF